MKFWDKLRWKLTNMMNGRYGVDQLSIGIMIVGLVLYFVNLFLRSVLLSWLALALYLIVIFRMLSKNRVKRAQENQKVMAFYYQRKIKLRQAWMRFKNRKEYKYFKCPECHAILRLKRGSGQTHVTCGKCKHQFDQKA